MGKPVEAMAVGTAAAAGERGTARRVRSAGFEETSIAETGALAVMVNIALVI